MEQGRYHGKIAKAYADFKNKHHGAATAVFDGDGAGPSIKDNAHQRREKKPINYPVVNFTSETDFEGKQEEFLSRGSNKQQLIS